MNILVTGAAGFIGFHLIKRLLEDGSRVTCVDNINDYYDIKLKNDRLRILHQTAHQTGSSFIFEQASLQDTATINSIFSKAKPCVVVNLAAQAGVRHSITHPAEYIQSNLVGFSNILEASRTFKVGHLIYASSSSVYGGNQQMPLSEDQNVDHPLSLYAATKKSNELMAHSYSNLYDLPTTGLRFFTVYGPWGRPDMALFLFTKAILEGQPIKIYNHGQMIRDFTYIDDVVESICRLIPKPPQGDKSGLSKSYKPSNSWAPYQIYNVGNGNPVPLMEYIHAIEEKLNITSEKNLLPMQMGDVPITSASNSRLYDCIGFKPQTSVKDGISRFIDWYKSYYGI